MPQALLVTRPAGTLRATFGPISTNCVGRGGGQILRTPDKNGKELHGKFIMKSTFLQLPIPGIHYGNDLPGIACFTFELVSPCCGPGNFTRFRLSLAWERGEDLQIRFSPPMLTVDREDEVDDIGVSW